MAPLTQAVLATIVLILLTNLSLVLFRKRPLLFRIALGISLILAIVMIVLIIKILTNGQ